MSASTGMARIAIVIGLLGMVGPFAIDMYLPALPLVTEDLGATPQAVQFTLSAFFAAFGLSQLVYGPLPPDGAQAADLHRGRGLPPRLVGLCRRADGRRAGRRGFVQGLGAATVMVVPRAIIRDLHTGPAATRLMATVMLVISISPMLAPLAGSAVLTLRRLALVSGRSALLAVLSLAAHRLRPARDASARAARGTSPAARGAARSACSATESSWG